MQKTPHTFYRGGDLSSVLLKLIPLFEHDMI